MGIWHQSFTVLQNLCAYEKALREHFACGRGYSHEPPKAERLGELASFYRLNEFSPGGPDPRAAPPARSG